PYRRQRQLCIRERPIIEFPAVYEMLSVMKAKLDASRCLLYETARYVDLYKAYEDIEKERKLTPEEKAELKTYRKYADACTPLAKGLSSEYCNQNAYDCIQVHGGSGFMKDYACERVYRDARITSIYEGTTQLQVVAAIRHVTTGTYKALMDIYAAMPFSETLAPVKERLAVLVEKYQAAIDAVQAVNDPAYTDFMARRLVEMAGNLVMAYLLATDATRYGSESMAKSALVYANMAEAEVNKHSSFIASFKPEELALYIQA
ncbi:MAG: acyl-CoA dehydrogenase, partial [Muribaculaceae bacterium]|nr:acyl-CoA dehydrogenase [Muribaculaceae bacterium]